MACIPGLGTLSTLDRATPWHGPCSKRAMESLRCCEHLRREHRLIGEVVAGIDALAECRRTGAEVPALPIAGAIDFFAAFVAACHDAKEERALFPVLVARGVDDEGLMAALQAQHTEGARLLDALRPLSSRQRVAGGVWELLEAYLGLVRGHIASEDEALFPFAERVLSRDDDSALERAFREIEDRTLGQGGSDALVALGGAVATASAAVIAERRRNRPPLTARDVMRQNPVTVGPNDSLARAAELMRSLRLRELPVVADGELVGLLARTDMEPHLGHYEWTVVRAAMTSSPVGVAPEMPARAVARLLLGRGFNAVPVTEGRRLVGIIARNDLLRAFAADAGR